MPRYRTLTTRTRTLCRRECARSCGYGDFHYLGIVVGLKQHYTSANNIHTCPTEYALYRVVNITFE